MCFCRICIPSRMVTKVRQRTQGAQALILFPGCLRLRHVMAFTQSHTGQPPEPCLAYLRGCDYDSSPTGYVIQGKSPGPMSGVF